MQRALVEQAARGDEDAFASLAAASADRLMAIAFRILRDVGRAEDAVQQTLLSAWRSCRTSATRSASRPGSAGCW